MKKTNDELEKKRLLKKSLNPALFKKINVDFKNEFDQFDWESYRWLDEPISDLREVADVLFYLALYGNKMQKQNSFSALLYQFNRDTHIYVASRLVSHVSGNLTKNEPYLYYLLGIIEQTNKTEDYEKFVINVMEWAKERNKTIYEKSFLILLDWNWRLVKKELYEFLEKGDDNFVAWIAFSFWHIYGDKAYADFKAQLSPKELQRIESLIKEILERYNNEQRVPPRILK